jgi:hypothetical protein
VNAEYELHWLCRNHVGFGRKLDVALYRAAESREDLEAYSMNARVERVRLVRPKHNIDPNMDTVEGNQGLKYRN